MRADESKRRSFIMYLSYHSLIKALPDDQVGKLFKHVMLYADTEGREDPGDLEGITSAVWDMIKSHLDSDREKYQAKCDKNQENGRLGGRPKNQTVNDENQTVSNENQTVIFENPKKPDIDIDIDMDMDNDIGIDNDMDNVNAYVMESDRGKETVRGSEQNKQPSKQSWHDALLSLCNGDKVFYEAVLEWLQYRKETKQAKTSNQQIQILVQDLAEGYHNDGAKIKQAIHRAISGNYDRVYIPLADDASKQADEPKSDPVPEAETAAETPMMTIEQYLAERYPEQRYEVQSRLGDQMTVYYWNAPGVLYPSEDIFTLPGNVIIPDGDYFKEDDSDQLPFD